MRLLGRKSARALTLGGAALVAVGIATGAFARTATAPIGTGVVVVETSLGYQNGAAAGTGMVLTSSGEVLTNNHVIRGATTLRVVVPKTGRSYKAQVVGYDVADDVAVLKLQGASHLATVSIGDSSRVRVGQRVTAIGNAGGTGSLASAPGAITGLGKTITASDEQGNTEQLGGLIQTDADLQPGDSGGPLVDSGHKVVGMDTAASSGYSFTAKTNDAYAIPIKQALTVAKQIASGQSSATVHVGGTAFLGVEVQGAGDSGYPSAAGATIVGVLSGSPADQAGLAAGDTITAVNGQSLSSPKDLSTILFTKSPGNTVQLTWVDQYGTQQTATVTLASGPPQ